MSIRLKSLLKEKLTNGQRLRQIRSWLNEDSCPDEHELMDYYVHIQRENQFSLVPYVDNEYGRPKTLRSTIGQLLEGWY